MTTATQFKQLATSIDLRNLSIGYKPSRKETKVVASNLNTSLRPGELVCLLADGSQSAKILRHLPCDGSRFSESDASHLFWRTKRFSIESHCAEITVSA